MVSAALPNPNQPGGSIQGVLRVDPVSGATSLLAQLPFGVGRAAAYDSFRERLVVNIEPFTDLRLVDSAGDVTTLPSNFGQGVKDVAPTGDGRIYLLATSKIGYVDAVGATHDLLDVGGSSVFNPQLSPSIQAAFAYDAATNSLVIADQVVFDIRIRLVPLSRDGSMVAGAIQQTTVVGSSMTGFEPVAVSPMPAGKLLLTIDDNSNTAQPRLQLIDPVEFEVSVFAVTVYFCVGGEVTGCYSAVREQAVVLDSLNDFLRAYNQGESGAGTVFASEVSQPNSSGESSRLLEIGLGVSIAGDLNGDNQVDGADLGVLLGSWGACPGCPADLNGDGVVDGSDLGTLLGAWTG